MTRPPDRRWTPEEMLALIEPIRERVEAILEQYRIAGEDAETILSHAWVAVALGTANDDDRRRVFLHAVERACRELRAERGPPEEEEEGPYVH